ncbi:MAG: sigma-70 family RNA polymerase sigma factor [Bacteroidota bacterium]
MLKNGKEQLFEQIFLAHFESCQHYLISNHKASFELAYDITMDTLIQFRQRILTDKVSYGNLRYLFTVMASQNLIKHHKKNQKERLESFIIGDSQTKPEIVYEALSNAWNELEPESKKVLEEFYYNKTPLIKIANKLGISDSTMRKKKQRCLEKLRNLFMHKYSLTNEK